jgi:septal ring factor EnvC (AmiA/AmiB activator)
MAGLASNERNKGDRVSRGDAIGHLGGPISDGDAFLIEESAPSDDAVTSLYFQMRRNGDPIDPTPWLE